MPQYDKELENALPEFCTTFGLFLSRSIRQEIYQLQSVQTPHGLPRNFLPQLLSKVFDAIRIYRLLSDEGKTQCVVLERTFVDLFAQHRLIELCSGSDYQPVFNFLRSLKNKSLQEIEEYRRIAELTSLYGQTNQYDDVIKSITARYSTNFPSGQALRESVPDNFDDTVPGKLLEEF